MMPIPLLFDPKESLDIVMYHNPKLWGVDILNPKLEILRQVNKYGLSHSKALGNCISNCRTMADRILVMAAYQHIIDQKAIHYGNICKKIAKVRLQESALTANTYISTKDKAVIFEFYAKEIEILEAEKALLLECPELCRHLQTRHDQELTTNTKES